MSNKEKLSESEWIKRVKDLPFPKQLKLAVALGLLDAGYLPFEQRKDVVHAGVDIYADVHAVEIITKFLDDDAYEDSPLGQYLTLNEQKLLALELWAHTKLDEVRPKILQFMNLVDMAKGAKEAAKS